MSDIIVAIITSSLALAGVIITVVVGNKRTSRSIKEQGDLTLYRIHMLEEKVEKHNQVIERVYILERNDAVKRESIKVINNRIKDLEEYHK